MRYSIYKSKKRFFQKSNNFEDFFGPKATIMTKKQRYDQCKCTAESNQPTVACTKEYILNFNNNDH